MPQHNYKLISKLQASITSEEEGWLFGIVLVIGPYYRKAADQ